MKRFTDTTKWTQNKWFRELSNENKIFWLYILDVCDPVGVWEVDIDFFTLIIGYTYSMDELEKIFKNQIHIYRNGKKWWIKGFCDFQYGELREDGRCKPHLYYIALLKRHGLWQPYLNGMHTLKEKEKEKDKDKDKDKDKEKNQDPPPTRDHVSEVNNINQFKDKKELPF